MLQYRYCPLCAGRLQELQLATEDRPRLVCGDCGHIFYINPKIVSGTLPIQQGKVWLLRRGIEPRAGYWTHPAGYQEWNETTEQAAVRETREELGCEVTLDHLLGVYSRADAPVVNVIYVASLADPYQQPRITPEAVEVQAFQPEDIPWDGLAFISTERALRDWIATLGRRAN